MNAVFRVNSVAVLGAVIAFLHNQSYFFLTQMTSADPPRRTDVLYALSQFVCHSVTSFASSMPAAATNNTAKHRIDELYLVLTHNCIVKATGRWVHSDIFAKVLWFIPNTIQGRHVQTIPIQSTVCSGMAVNAAGTLMAIASSTRHQLQLYSLPSGMLTSTIGGKGCLDGELSYPTRVVFGRRDDVLIVADRGNNRIQEFGCDGSFKRSVLIDGVTAIAVSHDTRVIAVGVTAQCADGTTTGYITMIDYDEFRVTQWFGIVYILGGVSSICFSPDDSCVLITSGAHCVSVLSVSDGCLVRNICPGLTTCSVGLHHHSVCIDSCCDGILVCDKAAHRVTVWGSDGVGVLGQVGTMMGGGRCDGQLWKPIDVTCVRGKLYVLDGEYGRVQVFV